MELIDVEQMIGKVRNGTVELKDTYLHDEDIISLLDDGLVDASSIIGTKYLNYISKEETIDLVSGQSTYDIPADALEERVEALRIFYNNQYYDLKEMLVDQEVALLNLNTGVVPKYYIVKAGYVQIYPTPAISIANGLIFVYPVKQDRLDKRLGRVNKIESNSRIYFDEFYYADSDGLPRINENEYISSINKTTGNLEYTFRVASINTTDSYIEVFKGITGAAVTSVSLGGNYIEVGVDLSNVIPNDVVIITGSTLNDGTYTIVGVDISSNRLHLRETLPSAIVDGVVAVPIPTMIDGIPISVDPVNLNYLDYITIFNKTCFVTMPRVVQDYIVAYTIKKVFDKAQEPNQEAMQNLQRLAQILDDSASDRNAQLRFRYRGLF